MDIFSQLSSDHDQVKALFEKIAAAPAGERTHLFNQVKVALIAHSKAEDQTFYSELETDDELEDRIIEAREDHEAIDQLLDELSGIPAEEPTWLRTFNELVRTVERHVRFEEDDIFPVARQMLDADDADELGRSMKRLEEQFKPQANA
jgi:hemerythrin superfamily protein